MPNAKLQAAERWDEKALASAVVQRWPGGMTNGKERDLGKE
jgi:hypothetical protein